MDNEIILMDQATGQSLALKPTSFAELGVKERQDLEEWIKKHPGILGMELLLITSEYDRFDKSDKRLDLLALDTRGTLVIIELKRDMTGSFADLQAIHYAAFCSTMTFETVISLYADFAKLDKERARKEVQDFVGDPDFSAIDNRPKIILAAGAFNNQDVTSCVLWLRGFGVDISCVEITPYRIPEDGRLILCPRVIIPLPEAQDYIVNAENKEVQEGKLPDMQRLYQERIRQILDCFQKLAPGKGSRTASAKNYVQIPTGRPGVHFEWIFSGRGQDKRLNVAIHFEMRRRALNQKLCAALAGQKAALEASLGETLHFKPDWTQEWSAVYVERLCEPWTQDIALWASEMMNKLMEAAQPLLDEFWSREQILTDEGLPR